MVNTVFKLSKEIVISCGSDREKIAGDVSQNKNDTSEGKAFICSRNRNTQ